MPSTLKISLNFAATDIANFENNYVQFDSGTITTFDPSLLASNDFNFSQKITSSVSKTLSSNTLSSNSVSEQKKHVIKCKIQKVMTLIKSSPYDEGIWGVTDHELVNIYSRLGNGDFLDICNGLWAECFKAQNQSHHAQLLNVFVNISDVVDAESFLPYAISAIAHQDIRIKEAAIAMFERWDNPEHKPFLEKTSDSGIGWLDQYKHEVMESLGS
jgi:hypothetical protein